MADDSPDSKVSRYAMPQGVFAGGVAMFLVIFGARWLDVALTLRRSYNGRFVLMVGTFLFVAVTTIVWRIVRRARNPSLYRASGKPRTVDEYPRAAAPALLTVLTLYAPILR